MKRREFLKAAAAAGAGVALPGANSAAAEKPSETPSGDLYPPGPDSRPQPGIPKGSAFRFTLDHSRYYPGTQRKIDVFVPAQYTPAKAACVWVSLDGLMQTLPAVFDNLIHKQQMPVTIAIGLHPGQVNSAAAPENPRFNRSFEFDSLTDVLARFILEEVLPAVEQQKTPDGRSIRLSEDPNDRGITGASSGGIAAFTVAWQRPDVFRRVYTMIGTYVGMRGGDRYPVLVRKTEPKPLRIFLQDGDKDGWPGGLELGDWWMSNQALERSLTFAGYDVRHAWGVEGHSGHHGESILPDVLRWLWRDWPKPIVPGQTSNFAVKGIVAPGEDWEPAIHDDSLSRMMIEDYFPRPLTYAGGIAGELPPGIIPVGLPDVYNSPPVLYVYSTIATMASDHKGTVYMQNSSNGEILLIDSAGHLKLFARVERGNNGLAFGPDGKLYVAEVESAKILTIDSAGKRRVLAEGIRGNQLTVTHEGRVYVSGMGSEDGEDASQSDGVWLIELDGSMRTIASGLRGPAGISLTPDGLWLCVAENRGHHAYNYQIRSDGTIDYGEPFYWLHVPDAANDCGAMQLCMDRQGWTYVATRMGVQVLDRNGRVTAILPVEGKQLAGICFGDADFQTLYVSTGDAIYRRRVNTTGAPGWLKPIQLPPWNAA